MKSKRVVVTAICKQTKDSILFIAHNESTNGVEYQVDDSWSI
ncbi:MAG: hypothetical protein WC679_00990 [Bacteroidales bacterium]|jgi:hypothetical protein